MDYLPQLIQIAQDAGADVVGVAPIALFKDFPMQENPIYMMPEAKSLIVLGHRTMRGSYRGTEEGTFLGHYATMGTTYIQQDIVPFTARAVSIFIEDLGYEAMPIGNHFGWAAMDDYGEMKRHYSVPARPGGPLPDVRLDLNKAACLAGLGELGYSGRVLNPIYGPRLVFGCVLTEMELPSSPMVAPGTVCTGCKRCATECPGACISTEETENVRLGDYVYTVGKYDLKRCEIARTGSEITDDGSYKPNKYSPFCEKPLKNSWFASGNICAGHGCQRACFMELEEKKRITNLFDTPFRRHAPWEINWEDWRSGKLVNDTGLPNANVTETAKNIIDIDE